MTRQDFDEPRMTANQKEYLLFLMSTMCNENIREGIRKRLGILSRLKAAKIIKALVGENEEGATEFF